MIDAKSFLPDSIISGKLAIGKQKDNVLSSVGYLKPDTFLFNDESNFVYANKIPEQNYFDSISVFFVNANGIDRVDRIQLTISRKNQPEENLEDNNNAFIEKCISHLGKPDKKYLVALHVRNSDKKLYLSALLWLIDDHAYFATYRSKRYRDEYLEIMDKFVICIDNKNNPARR